MIVIMSETITISALIFDWTLLAWDESADTEGVLKSTAEGDAKSHWSNLFDFFPLCFFFFK